MLASVPLVAGTPAAALDIATSVKCESGVTQGQYLATPAQAGDTITFTYDPTAAAPCQTLIQWDLTLNIVSGTTGAPTPGDFGRLDHTLDGSGILVVSVQQTPSTGSTLLNFTNTKGGDFSFIYQALFTTVNTDSGSNPPDVIQQFGKHSTMSCDDIQPIGLDWGGAASGGWSESWAQWVNEGDGGVVCTRTLTYSNSTGKWTVS